MSLSFESRCVRITVRDSEARRSHTFELVAGGVLVAVRLPCLANFCPAHPKRTVAETSVLVLAQPNMVTLCVHLIGQLDVIKRARR
mmetsp:Transcript_116567/g.226726  ORF Transcript_116567/g.226726 Transcript_116567/m.226726 type:complete len:86 (-) Transcript_116567:86-343(-)